jgi:hypothetical protein
MKYGRGYKQQRIKELGLADKLTWGNIVRLYGKSKAQDELDKLVELGLVVKPDLKRPNYYENSICYNKKEWNRYYNTKIVWIDEDKVK